MGPLLLLVRVVRVYVSVHGGVIRGAAMQERGAVRRASGSLSAGRATGAPPQTPPSRPRRANSN
eukprot:294101-Lingulodinium_polyedra.AAC.1